MDAGAKEGNQFHQLLYLRWWLQLRTLDNPGAGGVGAGGCEGAGSRLVPHQLNIVLINPVLHDVVDSIGNSALTSRSRLIFTS